MDLARGVVIVGVVYNHTVDGLLGAAIIGPTHLLAAGNNLLYIIRMPMLALLVGLFIPSALAKRGSSAYLRERLGLLIHLYLVWYAIQGLLEVMTSNVKNKPRDLCSLVTVWEPIAHLWFLPFLVVATALIAVTRLYATRTRRIVGAVVLLALSVWLWGRNAEVAGLRGLSLLFFIAAGSMLGLTRMVSLLNGRRPAWLLVGAGSAVGFALLLLVTDPIPASLSNPSSVPQRIASIGAAVLGIVMVLALCVALSRSSRAVWVLAPIGQNTLPIYLAHVVVVAGVRIMLSELAAPHALVYVATAVPLGVVVPLVAARFAVRHGSTSWIFQLPAPLTRRLGPSERPATGYGMPVAAPVFAVPAGPRPNER